LSQLIATSRLPGKASLWWDRQTSKR